MEEQGCSLKTHDGDQCASAKTCVGQLSPTIPPMFMFFSTSSSIVGIRILAKSSTQSLGAGIVSYVTGFVERSFGDNMTHKIFLCMIVDESIIMEENVLVNESISAAFIPSAIFIMVEVTVVGLSVGINEIMATE